MKEWRLVKKAYDTPQSYDILKILGYCKSIGEIEELKPTVQLTAGFDRNWITLGYYQDVDREVKLENCKKYNIPVIRRWFAGMGSTFGGKWPMVYQAISTKEDFPTADETYRKVVGGVMHNTLRNLGVDSEYIPPNDCRVHHKKIVGGTTAMYGDLRYVACFTNLSLPDMDMALEVLSITPDKFKDKFIKEFRSYVGTIETDGTRKVTPDEVMNSLAKEHERIFDAKLIPEGWTEEEMKICDKYNKIINSEDYLFRKSTNRFLERNKGYRTGFHQEKYRKLFQCTVAIDEENKIKDIMLAGDFEIAPPQLDEEIELKLKNVNSKNLDAITAALSETIKPGHEIIGASVEEIVKVIHEASKKATT